MVKPLKVMILEDTKTDQELVKRQILKYNPNSLFTVAENKSGFFEKIDWFLPDLVLADYHLPDFTGLDAIVHMKENTPFVPIIFVTGGLNPNDPLAEVVLNVADGYVLKTNLDTLHSRIKEIMDKNAIKASKFAKAAARENNQKIKILKTISLLQNSGNFSGKEELLTLVKSMQEDIFEEE